MNSPYYKRFKVTQRYVSGTHDGLDLVGLDSKDIHSTVNGKVLYAGWENINNSRQGFGKYVKIQKDNSDMVFYYAHLSDIYVKKGDRVRITQVIGKEGSTGYSTGSHCHYCCRKNGVRGNDLDISKISGIPNKLGIYDDGYREGNDGYLENSSYKGNSIVDALKQIGVDSSFSNRKKIASRNNISNYTGTATQNTKLLNLLKKGKLIK